MGIEELFHHFGCKTEAEEVELHRRLVEAQTKNADLAKEMHELG